MTVSGFVADGCGMRVSAEIKQRERTVLEYRLSPLTAALMRSHLSDRQ